MNSLKVKLWFGIMVLIAAFVASQVMYWRNVSVLHNNLSGALGLTEEMHDAETFHSSMHSMLISARLFVKKNRKFEQDEYARHKSAAKGALERLQQHHGTKANPDGQKGAPQVLLLDERLDAVATRFALLERTLDAATFEGSATPARFLAEGDMIFDDIFYDYYLKLHESHDMQINRMRGTAHRVKTATDIYFAAQLFLALVAGAAVLIYIDKVVLKMHAVTERYALTDSLTSLYNRRYVEKYLSGELERSARYRRHFALALIDVDNFKAFNDAWGHPAGDKLLKDLAALMQGSVRRTDTTARYGGEEFLIVFPELDKAQAFKAADKIRSTVAAHAFTLPHSEPSAPVSVSIGVAVFPEDGDTVNAIVKKADVMLYKAKNEGKNRVMV